MKSNFFEKIYRFLISRQFAVWSLVVLAFFLILGGTLPNPFTLSESEYAELENSRPILFWLSSNLETTRLMGSPFFLILPGSILLSIALCTIRRLKRETPRSLRSSAPTGARVGDFDDAIRISTDRSPSSAMESIKTLLRGLRWRLEEAGGEGESSLLEARCFARKGEQGFWGSVVFHLSMLILLMGIIVSMLGRFDAEMVLAEGQTLSFVEDQLLRVNRKGSFSPRLPGTLISLDKFESTFVDDKYPVDYAAHLKLMNGPLSIRQDAVRVNKPLRHDRWEIFLHRYGFAPRFEIRDAHDRLVFDSFVNLVISQPGQVDDFVVPFNGLRIEAAIYPDHEKRGETSISRSQMPRNPVMLIRAIAHDETMGEHEVKLGESADFGGYRIAFADLRYWAWFGIVYDPGYGFIVIGFFLCVAGLTHRFAYSEKWIYVNVERQNKPENEHAVVYLSGRSKYFPALFERELGDIRELLSLELGDTGINGGE
jgi:cytochrome c biogenesis protein ResB